MMAWYGAALDLDEELWRPLSREERVRLALGTGERRYKIRRKNSRTYVLGDWHHRAVRMEEMTVWDAIRWPSLMPALDVAPTWLETVAGATGPDGGRLLQGPVRHRLQSEDMRVLEWDDARVALIW